MRDGKRNHSSPMVLAGEPSDTGSGVGLCRHKQRKFGRSSHIAFTNPDFVKYAESFGAKGYRVEQAADLAPTLRQALAEDTVVVIDSPVDYAENMKLTEKLGQLHVKI